MPGAVAITVVEDNYCLEETFFHNAKLGFNNFVFISKERPELTLSSDAPISIQWVPTSSLSRDQMRNVLNDLIAQLSGRWVYHSYNSEFLYFPYCETRTIDDLARFMEEERRKHVFCYTIDLYNSASDLLNFEPEDAFFDGSGYYAMNRFEKGQVLDRQIDVFGGLKWRYSEHVPWDRQRIDRIAFFKAEKGLSFGADFRLNEPELNTHSCPWHHNVTGALASYRTAKSLRRNPGSAAAIGGFKWERSTPFDWSSKQLLDLGLIEAGQWF